MINTGDTAFILAAAGLVLLMTPGLVLFYGGMVRAKNILGTILQGFIMISVVSMEWFVVGYSMAFGPDVGGIVGDWSCVMLQGVGTTPSTEYATTIRKKRRFL